jgi:hypothetical protein
VFTGGGNALQTRSEDNYVTRARGYITTDVREQTSSGTPLSRPMLNYGSNSESSRLLSSLIAFPHRHISSLDVPGKTHCIE